MVCSIAASVYPYTDMKESFAIVFEQTKCHRIIFDYMHYLFSKQSIQHGLGYIVSVCMDGLKYAFIAFFYRTLRYEKKEEDKTKLHTHFLQILSNVNWVNSLLGEGFGGQKGAQRICSKSQCVRLCVSTLERLKL